MIFWGPTVRFADLGDLFGLTDAGTPYGVRTVDLQKIIHSVLSFAREGSMWCNRGLFYCWRVRGSTTLRFLHPPLINIWHRTQINRRQSGG